jgi:HEAT repeat protein
VLARSAEPAALAALARLLGSDSDPYVRGATARALAARAREPAVRVLLEQAARSDTDADVRAAAVQVLTRS